MDKTEYRVRPVMRFIVTRYHEQEQGADSRPLGEYENEDTAYQVGYALCKAEHDRLGYQPGDMRIIYPRHPKDPKDPTLTHPNGLMKAEG